MELFSRKPFWKRIAADWRIISAIVAFEFVGAGIGLLIAPHFDIGLNLWMGAALGGPLGFVAGLGWTLTCKDREGRILSAETGLVGLIVFAVGAFAYFFMAPFATAEVRAIAQIKSMDGALIKSIAVYNSAGNQKLVEVSDRVAVMDFSDRIKDIAGYSPNHPVYTASWHVMLSGPDVQELDFYYESSLPESIIGEINLGNASPRGHFSSKGLRTWFAKYVPNAGKES